MFLNILKSANDPEHIAGTPPRTVEVASASENVQDYASLFHGKISFVSSVSFPYRGENIYQMTVTLAVVLFNIKWYYFNV